MFNPVNEMYEHVDWLNEWIGFLGTDATGWNNANGAELTCVLYSFVLSNLPLPGLGLINMINQSIFLWRSSFGQLAMLNSSLTFLSPCMFLPFRPTLR